MGKRIIPALILLLACIVAASQQAVTSKLSQRKIDSLALSLMKAAEVPGLCIGIIKENKPAFIKAYGFKKLDSKELNDTATIFHAASFSKSVFAYLVMQLVDSGVINLDKPVYEYLDQPLPAYNGYEDLTGDERWKLITARHCLSHTTGFPNWRWLNPRGNNKLEFFFTPGQRYAYSGEGLQLLQLVIEHITKRGLESMMREKVFLPLGMRRSSYIWQLKFENNHALPYDENNKELQKIKRSEAYAAGSMETTIADYTRFMVAVLQGKGLSAQSKKEMLTPQIAIKTKYQFPSLNTDTTNENSAIRLSYGVGWGLFYGKYGLSFFKEGHIDGWENYTVCFPDKGFGIVLMTNSSNGESMFKQLVTGIIGEASIPWEWEGYTPYEPTIQLSAGRLHDFTGVYERDGVKANIILEGDRLYVECKEKGLPKTLLYASNDTTFFIKQFALELEFIRDGHLRVVKVNVNDEGQKFTMRKNF